MTLPRYGGFKSSTNGKYLTYTDKDFLQYSSNDLINSHNKYALEPAANGDDNVFNIRCCYNNKYWKAESSSSLWIVAAASETNENESDSSCTLFKVITTNNSAGEYEITHVNRGEPVVLYSDNDHSDCLYIANSNTGRSHTVIDWEAVVILPKYVVFKGDNDKYLQRYSKDGHEYLQFGSTDPSSHDVGNEVFVASDGSARIKSLAWGKFWRSRTDNTPNWIWATSSDTSSNDEYTLFTPIKINSDNLIGLKSVGDELFLKRLTLDSKVDCLAAEATTINKYCEMEISEYVASRSIYNVVFRLKDSRIYGETIETVVSQTATNDSSGELTQGLDLSHTNEVSNTWSSTLEMKLGFGLEFSGGIPLILDEGVSVLGEITGSYTWGETLTTKTEKESTV